MNDKFQIQFTWTVEKTLQEKPETASVFIGYRTQCVGCLLQKFCTLKDVAETYRLDLSKLLQDLNHI